MNLRFNSEGPRFGDVSFYINNKKLYGYANEGSFQIPKNA